MSTNTANVWVSNTSLAVFFRLYALFLEEPFLIFFLIFFYFSLFSLIFYIIYYFYKSRQKSFIKIGLLVSVALIILLNISVPIIMNYAMEKRSEFVVKMNDDESLLAKDLCQNVELGSLKQDVLKIAGSPFVGSLHGKSPFANIGDEATINNYSFMTRDDLNPILLHLNKGKSYHPGKYENKITPRLQIYNLDSNVLEQLESFFNINPLGEISFEQCDGYYSTLFCYNQEKLVFKACEATGMSISYDYVNETMFEQRVMKIKGKVSFDSDYLQNFVK